MGLTMSRKQPKGSEMRQHMWRTENSLSLLTQTSMFSQEALEMGWALIDCGATRCMGAWKELDGLARMNEQLYGSPWFSLDRTRKTWHTFANGERPQSEHEVAFQVNVRGKMGDCKIAYLNERGVPILLSVQSLSKMGAIVDFSTDATFFRNLTDQGFVLLEKRGKWTSLFVTGEGYALSINL